MLPHFDLLTAEISKHLGMSEDIGSNSGNAMNKYLALYPNWNPGDSWCVAMALQLWHIATVPLERNHMYDCLYGHVGTTAMREDWVKRGGLYVRGAVAKGAIGTLWNEAGDDDIHTFICLGDNDDPDYIITADGNWGNEFKITRHRKDRTGLLLPKVV